MPAPGPTTLLDRAEKAGIAPKTGR
jgi:hypothetical protein